MKPALILLLWCLLQAPALAQTFRIDTLPTEGVLLNQGWRWHTGDNPAWAMLTFDASRWDTVSAYPTIDQLAHFRQ